MSPTTAAYTPHAPIVITTNEDFKTQGWPGAGEEKDPFVIEGLNITTTSVCINVTGTNVFFEIRNCLLDSPTYSAPYGAICFDGLKYGSVIGCVIDNHLYGTNLTASGYCRASDNLMTYCGLGFVVERSHNCIFENNTMTETGTGFTMVNSQSCSIISCTVVDYGMGIRILSSDMCTFINNNLTVTPPMFIYTFNDGVTLFNSESCTFINNTVVGSIYCFRLANCSACTS
jgi:parallel beta-helix repeat protein